MEDNAIAHMGAIIFDMDGVLVESMPLHYQAMMIAIKEIATLIWIKENSICLRGCLSLKWLYKY
jgi:beta-phosphoglucomutase-like phosphatase (HAD superfamily)